ncbi:MAG TPA: ABC transporter ATP-binding protein [Ignavibacteriaceae bacterium]|nr:ABC transporter ATP-binding protein [Ignavibacteriaceae bacterium]
MNRYELKLDSLTKYFGRRLVFRDLNIEYCQCGIYGISGPNGSGKSTLLKIIAGISTPSKGKITHTAEGKEIDTAEIHERIGFVSPYLVLYEEFSCRENIEIMGKIRGIEPDEPHITRLLETFGLADRQNDRLKFYSSGMKQRMKFIFALLHKPALLILDEPTENLDNEGKNKIYELIKNYSASNIVLIASNEDSDLQLCTSSINLLEHK